MSPNDAASDCKWLFKIYSYKFLNQCRELVHDTLNNSLAACGLEEHWGGYVINLSSHMSHNNNTVIDVTSLLRLWSCCTNHNISSTQTQPYPTDRQIDRQSHQYTCFTWAGGTFFPVVLLCCVSFWFW
jgi:hypothetical protein